MEINRVALFFNDAPHRVGGAQGLLLRRSSMRMSECLYGLQGLHVYKTTPEPRTI